MAVTQAIFQGGASVTPAVSWNGTTSNKAMLSTEKIVLITGTDSGIRKLTLPKINVVAGDRYEVVWDISGASSSAYGVTVVSNSDSGVDSFDNKSVGRMSLIAKINEPNVPSDWFVSDVWEVGSFVANFNLGMNTSTNNLTVYFTRTNKIVTLHLSENKVTAGVTTYYWECASGTTPARLRPQFYSQMAWSGIFDNNVACTGCYFYAYTDGQLSLRNLRTNNTTTNWTSTTTNCGMLSGCMTYRIA
jgi:hypothetical protein